MDDGAARTLADLTPREREVALLVADGGLHKTAARGMGISEQTYKNHLFSIYRKTGAHGQLALAVWVMRQTGEVRCAAVRPDGPSPYQPIRNAVWSLPGRYWHGEKYVRQASVIATIERIVRQGAA